MGTIRCTRRQLARGLKIPLDERTQIVVGPDHAIGTLHGRAFDQAKAFVLPRCVAALKEIFAFTQSLPAQCALVVSHTDPDDADQLSSQRAVIARAWLEGDVQPWLDSYETSKPEPERWGAREDRSMLRALPDLSAAGVALPAPSPNQKSDARRDPLVAQYQAARGIEVDGIAGPITRKQLITDYFSLSRTSVRSDEEPSTDSSTPSVEPPKLDLRFEDHGAGFNFTLAQVGDARRQAEESAVDPAPAPEAESESEVVEQEDVSTGRSNARLDFFFFMGEAGVEPPKGSPDGPEYLEWIAAATTQRDFIATTGAGAASNKLALTLFDKTGRSLHAGRAFSISGPEELAGTTNSFGEAILDDVTPGDYTLVLRLEFFEGADKLIDEYSTPLTVLPAAADAQVRFLGAVPRCTLARLRGMLFDTNKAFLLPSALEDLKLVRGIYELNSPSDLLVVGHTDTMAGADINDPLSLARAKSTLAYLQDDVDAWLSFYGSGVKQSQRWGQIEDEHMLAAILGLPAGTLVSAADMQAFQSARSITETTVGTQTRKALILEYMSLDGVKLDVEQFQIRGTAHGCGENFPLDAEGDDLDTAPSDRKEDASDRRVELFFFETEFGIVPKPPSENSKPKSTQYPAWRKLAELTFDSETGSGAGERPCHFSFLLETDDGVPLANRNVTIEILGSRVDATTDAEGLLQIDAVPAGDFLLSVGDTKMSIPALPLSETRAVLLVRDRQPVG